MTRALFLAVCVCSVVAGCGGDHDGGMPGADAGVAGDAAIGGDHDGGGGGGHSSGSLDTSFGNGGYLAFSAPVSAVAVDGDAIVTLHQNGALARFDKSGATLRAPGPADAPGELLLPGGGGGWFTVHADLYSSAKHGIARFGADLAIDYRFASTGTLSGFRPAGAAVGTDGTALVLSTSDAGALLVRKLTSAGAVDTTFGTNGTASAAFPATLTARALKLDGSGRLLIAADSGFTPAVARLDAGGVPDGAFGDHGLVTLAGLGPRNVRDLVVDAHGRILVLGMSGSTVQVARLTAEGGPDPSFGTNGIATTSIPVSGSETVEARALRVTGDGKLVVACDLLPNGGVALARLSADGVSDDAFGDGGAVRFSLSPSGSPSTLGAGGALAIAGDGRMLLVGQIKNGSSSSGGLVARWP